MACVASPLAPDSPSCLHDDVAALYGEAQRLYADAQQDFNGDDAPAAWDLPEAMLTGGMPQGFENTRRDVGSLTMKIANKKADIEALLERMAKLGVVWRAGIHAAVCYSNMRLRAPKAYVEIEKKREAKSS